MNPLISIGPLFSLMFPPQKKNKVTKGRKREQCSHSMCATDFHGFLLTTAQWWWRYQGRLNTCRRSFSRIKSAYVRNWTPRGSTNRYWAPNKNVFTRLTYALLLRNGCFLDRYPVLSLADKWGYWVAKFSGFFSFSLVSWFINASGKIH